MDWFFFLSHSLENKNKIFHFLQVSLCQVSLCQVSLCRFYDIITEISFFKQSAYRLRFINKCWYKSQFQILLWILSAQQLGFITFCYFTQKSRNILGPSTCFWWKKKAMFGRVAGGGNAQNDRKKDCYKNCFQWLNLEIFVLEKSINSPPTPWNCPSSILLLYHYIV